MKFYLLLAMIASVSCTKSKDEKIISWGGTPQDFQGIWSGCANEGQISARTVEVISENSLAEIVTIYSGKGCNAGSEGYQLYTAYSHNGGNPYDLTLISAVVTPLNDSVATSMRNESFCNMGSWFKDTPINILNRNCDDAYFSFGERISGTLGRSGNSLRIEIMGQAMTFNLSLEPKFSNKGQTLANGYYTYIVGDDMAIHLQISGSNYIATSYDLTARTYFSETGTISSSGNNSVFTVGSYSPSGCDTDIGQSYSRPFVLSSLGLAFDFNPDVMIAEKSVFSEHHFRTEALKGFGTFTAGCF